MTVSVGCSDLLCWVPLTFGPGIVPEPETCVGCCEWPVTESAENQPGLPLLNQAAALYSRMRCSVSASIRLGRLLFAFYLDHPPSFARELPYAYSPSAYSPLHSRHGDVDRLAGTGRSTCRHRWRRPIRLRQQRDDAQGPRVDQTGLPCRRPSVPAVSGVQAHLLGPDPRQRRGKPRQHCRVRDLGTARRRGHAGQYCTSPSNHYQHVGCLH